MTIFSIAGCSTLLPSSPEFPQEFRGTWQREDRPENTLTITARNYSLSHQDAIWILDRVSGDTYHISLTHNRNWNAVETIHIVNGNLQISDCTGTNLSNCNGTWIRLR
ncbi:MAG: hypothetical protein FWG98_11740 [Candidatus Cloacimonetes bacterium]|nr:hypothetical protein [Candidatus Cloacimonadota bacterium]